MALPAAVQKALLKELKDLESKPDDGIRVSVNEENIAEVAVEMDGPASTPYEGGIFQLKLTCGNDYPGAPPKGFFVTKIFHPNVARSGEICVNVLKKDWHAEMGLRHVLLVIRCLLIQPFPDSALNEEAGRLLYEDYEEYAKHARLMTSIHALPAKRPMPLTATGGANALNSGNEQCPSAAETAPLMKKPKAETKSKPAAAKSKSLRRL